MIQTTTVPGAVSGRLAAPDVAVEVRTTALDQTCANLQRAVEQGRRLLEHPGVVRGLAHDTGDDELRDAAVHFADRWGYGLRVLVDDAAGLLADLQSAVRVYDEVERTSVPAAPPWPGSRP
jgi:hypothetical protein